MNGLNMYYEIHGSGRPLVLLHGGMTTIDTSFGMVLPSFAKIRQVIAVEQQTHGHTADIDRPLTFEQMADDTATLLQHLNIESADVFGYSDGGGVALQIAIRHPNLVCKLAVASAIYNRDGYSPEILEGLQNVTAEDMPAELREAYVSVAPNLDDWPKLIAKVRKQAIEFEGWSPEDIQMIEAPTMVMVGDNDIVRPEHAVELFRLLPQSQLAVLPGTDHSMRLRHPDLPLSMITEFLDAPMSGAM